jgi:flagellar hook-associated protein 3 FlgL
MQVSTSLQFDRASQQMVSIQNDLAKSQSQIAAQKQVINPSDAPDQAATITRLKSVISRQDTYTTALNQVQARLDAESTNLTSASDVLVRIKELAVQANNGSQGQVSRQAIATEMKGLRDQLLSLSNSTDPSGNYIFSGSKVRTPAFTQSPDGSVTYTGDQTRMHVAVGEQRAIAINRPGTNAFTRVVRTDDFGQQQGVGFFTAIDDLIGAVQNPDQNSVTTMQMQRGLTEMDALHTGVVMAQAEVGTDMKVVEQQGAVVDDTKLSLKVALSNVEDLDMTTAVTNMQKLMLSLEAAQSTFAKTSQMSLFKFLG